MWSHRYFWKAEVNVRAKRFLTASGEKLSVGSTLRLGTEEEVLGQRRLGIEHKSSQRGGLGSVELLVARGGGQEGAVDAHVE